MAQFDPKLLADRLVELFQTMLAGVWGGEIKETINKFERNAKEIRTNSNSVQILKLLVELIATRSYRYPKPSFEDEFGEWEATYGTSWSRSDRAKEELVGLVERAFKC